MGPVLRAAVRTNERGETDVADGIVVPSSSSRARKRVSKTRGGEGQRETRDWKGMARRRRAEVQVVKADEEWSLGASGRDSAVSRSGLGLGRVLDGVSDRGGVPGAQGLRLSLLAGPRGGNQRFPVPGSQGKPPEARRIAQKQTSRDPMWRLGIVRATASIGRRASGKGNLHGANAAWGTRKRGELSRRGPRRGSFLRFRESRRRRRSRAGGGGLFFLESRIRWDRRREVTVACGLGVRGRFFLQFPLVQANCPFLACFPARPASEGKLGPPKGGCPGSPALGAERSQLRTNCVSGDGSRLSRGPGR